jgi:ornithine carbamoyltransferase
MVRHVTKISDLTPEEFLEVIKLGIEMKKDPAKYSECLKGKTCLSMFSKPSLRTHVSLEVAMTRLGGHTIYYALDASAPLGKKETIEDTAKVISRMVDVCTARVQSKSMIKGLADNSSIPIINALDDWAHPLQMCADFITIYEKFGTFKGLKMAFYGDSLNNVTYDIMRACAMLGMECTVACPDDVRYKPCQEVIDEVAEINAKTGGKCRICHDPREAAKGQDIVYCDSWFSYGIPESEKEERLRVLGPFTVTEELMGLTSERSVFMNCLPAMRGCEETAEVIDGPKSIVFDEAENRVWSSMALICWLLDPKRK